MWLFRSSFPSGAGQDKPHSISAGIKPLSSAADVKFGEMAPNLLLHSKSQNAGAALRGQVKNIGWSMLIGLRVDFSPLLTFSNLWLPGSHSPVSDKEIGCSVGFMQSSPPRIYICPDFVGFPLIARNLASILGTLHSHKIQLVAQFGAFSDPVSSSPLRMSSLLAVVQKPQMLDWDIS